jgi:transcriptional repressor NrdR
MAELRELDQVAYVRFASVYRSFQDVNAFREEVERLQEAVAPAAATPEHQMSLLPAANKSAPGEGAP